VGAVVRAAALSSLAWWRFPTLRPRLRRPDRSSARELVGYGAWVQASNVAGVVNVESDRWVLAAVFSPTTVASFEIGSKIIGVFRLLPTFALAALFPVASQAHGAGRRQEVDRLYLRSTRYLTLAAAGGAALLVAAAEPLVTLWLGVRLNFARDVLWILAPALAFNLSTGAVAMLVRAEGHPAWETRYAAVSVVLNVGFTVPLLVAAGPVGAVAGSALGIALASAYFFSSFHRLSERPLAPLLRIVWPAWTAGALAALVGLAGSRLLSTPSTRPEALLALLVSAALALAAYVLLLTLFGFWSRSERDLVGRGLARARASIRPAEPQRSNE